MLFKKYMKWPSFLSQLQLSIYNIMLCYVMRYLYLWGKEEMLVINSGHNESVWMKWRCETLLCFLLILCDVFMITTRSVMYSMEPYLCVFFVFKKKSQKGFTSVYSENFNKVIRTLLKIAQVLFKHKKTKQ